MSRENYHNIWWVALIKKGDTKPLPARGGEPKKKLAFSYFYRIASIRLLLIDHSRFEIVRQSALGIRAEKI